VLGGDLEVVFGLFVIIIRILEVLTIGLAHDGTTHEVHLVRRKSARLVTEDVLDLRHSEFGNA
jgi:hypothetical protein